MNRRAIQDCETWYDANYSRFELCGEKTEGLLRTLLEQAHIAFHSIEHRTKTRNSFLDKCASSRYSDPTCEITDLCGLRIISYTKHDVDEISHLIEQEFSIDEKNSMDKAAAMKVDQVGYLSVHYVVKFSSSRANLPEYATFKDIRFEIQVRTLLQHAWAEIEHDRSYKFSGELPIEIKRRFYLLAGTLELIDAEFGRLSSEIDQYAKSIERGVKEDKLDVPIDSTSLTEYLRVKLPKNVLHPDLNGGDKAIIEELENFGVHTLHDLDALIMNRSSQEYLNATIGVNYLGILRDIMLLIDPKKYFAHAWDNHWCSVDHDSLQNLISRNPDIKKALPSSITVTQ